MIHRAAFDWVTSVSPSLVVADSFAQLVAHVLAHVPLDQAGNLYDPRYVAWARRHADAADRQLLEHDAALLARCWRADRSLDLLHGFCQLHRSLAAFERSCSRALTQLQPEQVDDPQLLAALKGAPAAELLYATLALLADRFASTLARLEPQLARACDQMQPFTRRLAEVVPGLAGARVELVWALGMHGRALRGRILVGAPSTWSRCSPARQAVLAAHEHLVGSAGADRTADYYECEWAALTGLAAYMHKADSELRAAHAGWLAELDLSDLTAVLLARGRVTPAQIQALSPRGLG